MKRIDNPIMLGDKQWKAWYEGTGGAVVDLGAPLDQSTTLTGGTSPAEKTAITGYSILQADSIDEAVALMDTPSLSYIFGLVPCFQRLRRRLFGGVYFLAECSRKSWIARRDRSAFLKKPRVASRTLEQAQGRPRGTRTFFLISISSLSSWSGSLRQLFLASKWLRWNRLVDGVVEEGT
jgi:hypothetical protein